MTAGSSAPTPSMLSQRLKTRSNFARRTRSTQRPSGFTGTRTSPLPAALSAASTASIVSRIRTSGVFPSADSPSNSTATFIDNLLRSSGGGSLAPRVRAGEAAGQGDPLPLGGVTQTGLNELVVAQPRRARGLRETRIVRRVGKNPRERIHLDDVGHASPVEAHVDARPVAAAEH